MKKKLMLLAGVLAVGMCVSSAAFAEESTGSGIKDDIRALLEDEDVRNALFGEDGLVSGFLPEGTDMQTVEEQIGLVESQGAQLIDSIQSRIDSADGSFDVSSLEGLAGQLVGAFTGMDFEEEGDLTAYLDTYTAINDAMKDFYRENNAETIDPADVQIVSVSHAYQDIDYDMPEFRFIAVLSQSNYSQDGDVLRFVSGATDPVMFTFSKAEDGTINVVDTTFAEPGEGWLDSLQAIADAVGCPVEDILDATDMSPSLVVTELISYLDEHEDITGIEYMGEIRSRDELSEIRDDILAELYPEYETEAETEVSGAETEAE